jgi:hypothetical protein
MKSQHLYTKNLIQMPKRITFKNDKFVEEKLDPEKYLRTLSLEDFLGCDNTRDILLLEHYDNFDKYLKPKLEYLYKKYNLNFRNNNFFGKDWDNVSGDCFADMIFNYLSVKYDLSLFYECPELAADLLCNNDK